jgi:dTDP-6-deoxy-L-talose 4-dehydrogenase (NAD+)
VRLGNCWENEMTTVLITGANGYIGSHAVGAFLERRPDWTVVAADFDNAYVDPRARFVEADILGHSGDPGLFDRLGRPDVVVHLAWRDGFDHNAQSHIDMLPAHYRFLKNMVDGGCRHIVIAGSFREYGPFAGKVSEDAPLVSENLYAFAKIGLLKLMEIYAGRIDGLCVQWLRFFTPYGDDARNNSIMSKILKWEAEGRVSFPFTEGKEEYDYIHIDDLASAIVSVASQTMIAGAVNIGSGRPTSLRDMVERFIAENGLKIRPEYGAFPSRSYDSAAIWADTSKLDAIMAAESGS